MQENKFEGNVFAGLQVVELAAGGPGAYTGKLFADYGAEVIRVEPKEGDPARLEKPFVKDTPGIENSLRYHYLNTNKKSVVIDITSPEGKKAFLDLAGTADLLIESFPPGYMDSIGLGYGVLSSVKPKIVYTAITPFGQTGLYKDYPFSDLTLMAMGGMLFLAGTDDDKPALAPDKQSFFQADLYAALASMVALFHADVTSEGQFIDVSIQEAVATALENAIQTYDLEGSIRRGSSAVEAGRGVYNCQDGSVYIMAAMGRNTYLWDPLVEWMMEEKIEGAEILKGEEWRETEYRTTKEAMTIFKELFERFASKYPKLVMYEESQKRKLALCPINNAKDILENPQFVFRNFFKTIYSEPAGSTITMPGAPVYIEKIPWELKNPAPALGQHTYEVLSQLGYSPDNIKSLVERGVIYVR
ncbi:MAG: CoA transferase [Firmicutes bacterium]|nr:CoA transferase [Bacillota bacterium]